MSSRRYKVNVSDQFEFEHPSPQELDIVSLNEGKYHILKDGRSFQADLIAADYPARQFTIKINGSIFHLKLTDKYDQLLKEMGLEINLLHKIKDVKAPMPGLVLNILVKVGQEVQKGDPLLILEAMKMENVIKSPGAGVLKAIHVTKGAAVDKGALLMEME